MLRLTATVLDTPDPPALARFYRHLLGFETVSEDPDWVVLRGSEGQGLSFQRESRYARPAWPAAQGEQQVQDHLDIAVDDLEAAVAHAVSGGAEVEEFQPQEAVRVLRDPHGHLFCLYLPD
ncbi:VOC family protein [Kineococcus sp. TBRC 1896]|uniref:VOC family protein n=1 Tax=Kineococcus mangrovi TaxID=1660183 RepID=A0ABV4I5N4_9ACTN